MRPLLTLVLLSTLASAQDSKTETAADLDKRVVQSLQKTVTVAKGLTLPMLFFMLDTSGDVDFDCFVDPIAVPKMDDVKTLLTVEAPLEEILQGTLKEKGLLHQVCQGVVVITNEKGLKAFNDIEWTGLTKKSLAEQKELNKRLDTVYSFKWDAYDPLEALKEFAVQSGVAINVEALKGFEIKREKRGMHSPTRTTLRGALVCLARVTGITFEVTKEGGLIAKPPPKK